MSGSWWTRFELIRPAALRLLAGVTAVVVGAGCAPEPNATPGVSMGARGTDITGTWEKTSRSACGRAYPDTVRFEPGGSYVGRSEPPGTYTHWDVGTFELVEPTHIRISLANDALVTYELSLEGDTLSITDPDGCKLSYRRSK